MERVVEGLSGVMSPSAIRRKPGPSTARHEAVVVATTATSRARAAWVRRPRVCRERGYQSSSQPAPTQGSLTDEEVELECAIGNVDESSKLRDLLRIAADDRQVSGPLKSLISGAKISLVERGGVRSRAQLIEEVADPDGSGGVELDADTDAHRCDDIGGVTDPLQGRLVRR